jgi:hypothetical protein
VGERRPEQRVETYFDHDEEAGANRAGGHGVTGKGGAHPGT